MFLASLGLSLGVFLAQFSFLGPEILGPKFAERDPFVQW